MLEQRNTGKEMEFVIQTFPERKIQAWTVSHRNPENRGEGGTPTIQFRFRGQRNPGQTETDKEIPEES